MKDNDTNLEGEFREPERLVESKTTLLTLKLFSFFFLYFQVEKEWKIELKWVKFFSLK